MIKSRLVDLKNEMKKKSEDEKETENPDELVDIAEKILDFNKQNQASTELKILAPDQMFN